MKIEAKVKGLTFRIKENEAIRNLRPEGVVELRHNPFIHPNDSSRNDPNAVEVWHGEIMLGFLGKETNERKAFFEAKKDGADINAYVVDFSYAHYDANLNMITGTFNDELDGYLGSVAIEFESAITENSYTIKGREHIRVTKIAGLIDDIGFVLPKHLYNWMTAKKMMPRDLEGTANRWWVNAYGETGEYGSSEFNIDRIPMSHEEYLAKIEKVRGEGLNLHDACEEYVRDGTTGEHTPHGLDEFVIKHSIKYISSEQILRRGKKYRVAGRYDLFAEAKHKDGEVKAVIDWKRSGSLKIAYVLQCAWYARQLKADEFWIVLFGTKNKCGYSVKRFVKSDIKLGCEIFDLLAKTAYKLNGFKWFKLFK